MTEITLSQILDARENRVKRQKELLSLYNLPVVCFTMNIAGPIKTSPLIERSFYEGIKLFKGSLPTDAVIHEEITTEATGCQGLFSIRMDSEKLKAICVDIEEATSLGRLFDIDVIKLDFSKEERKIPRNCIVCDSPGRACAAGRVHPVEILQEVTKKIMEDYFLNSDKERVSFLAVKSLIDEVNTTPKPGLVDRRNNGSHKDMNADTFEKSAYALKPYFTECFSIGNSYKDHTYDEIFKRLRIAGLNAEKSMYNATGGINTHKGIIYSMGILCAAIGKLWSAEEPLKSSLKICSESAKIVSKAVLKDFDNIDTSTAGGRLYLSYGLKGIRGEAASGFKSVTDVSLPCYKRLIEKNFSKNDAGAITLLNLIANVKDTNLYHRGGVDGALYAQNKIKELLQKSPEPSIKQIEITDDSFIEKNLSPGGCADLLAITYFLYDITN